MYIRRPLCVFTLLFVLMLAGIMLIAGDGNAYRRRDYKYEGRELTVEGTIKSIENKNNRSVIHLDIISPSDNDKDLSDKILIYLSEKEASETQLHIGQRVGIRGRLTAFKPAYNRGQFDMRSYYMHKHYAYACYDGHVEYKYDSYNLPADILYRIKLRTISVYETYYDERYSGIIKALVLAERSSLDEDVKEQYKNAGISHILALSSLHVVTMGFILFGGMRGAGISRAAAALISVVLIVLYCIMTGMPTSAVRALIMFILSMGAVLAGRTTDIRTSTAVAAFLMLAANPSYIYEAGFLLSFTAVLGIGFVYPSVRVITLYVLGRDRIRRLHRSNRRLLRAVMALLRTLLFSLALQTAIVPLTMWYYYQLPTYGIIVNLLVIPLAGALLTGSLVTGAAGNIALGAAGNGIGMAVSHAADGVCRISAKFTSAILSLYDLVTERTNELPGGLIITGRPELWQMIVYYTILTAVVTAGYILAGKERRLKRAAAGQRGALRYNSVEGLSAGRNGMIRYLRLRSAVLLGLLLTGTVILFIRTEPEYEISALYVGQGQCIVMHGNKIPTVIYDCGSTDVKEIGKYTVVPFLKYCGISSVDTVFLSHLDTDHVSGLIEILNMKASGVKIKRIVIPKGRSQQSSENYSLLLEAASVRGVPVYEMDRNDTVQWKRLTAECLSPCDGGERYADMNEGSLVLSMVYDKGKDRQRSINKNLLSEESKPAKDFRVLLTGDISCAVEDELAGNLTGKYDWLQIAHHGSRSAANEEFIKTVSPYIAVISAGIDNRYGHPHEETMDILKKHSDMITYITAEGGEIDCRVEERRGGIACYTGRFME